MSLRSAPVTRKLSSRHRPSFDLPTTSRTPYPLDSSSSSSLRLLSRFSSAGLETLSGFQPVITKPVDWPTLAPRPASVEPSQSSMTEAA